MGRLIVRSGPDRTKTLGESNGFVAVPRVACKARANRAARLREQGAGKAGDELDEISLAGCSGLAEHAVEMRLDRRLANPKRLRDLRHATDLNNGEQHAELARRQIVEPSDGLWREGSLDRHLVHEERSDCGIAGASAAAR